MNILLVEPDYVLSKTYGQALQAEHHLVAKSSAQGAVDALNQEKFDLIVLEIQMANHNGLEFLHELRSYSEWQDLPVIILTMTPKSSFLVQDKIFKNLGVSDYLYKPVTTINDLLESVERTLPEIAWTK